MRQRFQQLVSGADNASLVAEPAYRVPHCHREEQIGDQRDDYTWRFSAFPVNELIHLVLLTLRARPRGRVVGGMSIMATIVTRASLYVR
jgi:hypothetical protein